MTGTKLYQVKANFIEANNPPNNFPYKKKFHLNFMKPKNKNGGLNEKTNKSTALVCVWGFLYTLSKQYKVKSTIIKLICFPIC